MASRDVETLTRQEVVRAAKSFKLTRKMTKWTVIGDGRRRATRHRSSRSEHREAVVSQELSTSDRKTDRSLDADRRLRTLARPEAPEVRRRAGWRPLFPYRVSPVGRRGDLPFDVQATQRTASICRDPPRSAVIDDRETLDNRA